MTLRKTSSSTNPEQAARDRASLERALAALSADPSDTPIVAPLADLSRAARDHLRTIWPAVPRETRLRTVRAIVDDAERQVERNYDRALSVIIDDVDPDVRMHAWDGLWEDDSPELLRLLLDRVAGESDARVRAVMAEVLGAWAARVELNELETQNATAVRATLLRLVRNDPSAQVRRRALESAGYISGDAEIVAEIERMDALDDDERVSALRAMGRQCDPRWRERISREFSNADPELRFEAARAAGASGDQAYLPALIDLIDDEDGEVRLAAIASLGAIGGTMAVRVLRRLVDAGDPAVADAAQDALDEALTTSEESFRQPLFDLRHRSEA